MEFWNSFNVCNDNNNLLIKEIKSVRVILNVLRQKVKMFISFTYQEKKITKIFFLISGLIFLFCPLNTRALEICANKKNKIGTEFKYLGESDWQLLSTSRVKINSDLQEDVLKALFEAEANSRVKILRFANSKCDEEKCVSSVKMDEGSLSKQLKNMVTTSRCYKPDSFVEVSVKVSSKNYKN